LIRCSCSTAFSWGRTGFTVLAWEPSLSALSRALALPASVLGQVDRWEFRLLALICAWLGIGVFSESGDEGTDGETRATVRFLNHPAKGGSFCRNLERRAIFFSRPERLCGLSGL
jgi:hypothetical protein